MTGYDGDVGAARAVLKARDALTVLNWINNEAQETGLVLITRAPTTDVLNRALREAPSLPGVNECILRAMRDKAEAALIEAYDVLSAHLQADLDPPAQPPGPSGTDGHHGVAAFAYPPGFSGIDGA